MDSVVLLVSGIATGLVLLFILRLCSARQRSSNRLLRSQRSGDYMAIDDSAEWIIPEEHLNDEEQLLQLALEYGDLSPQEQQVQDDAARFTQEHPPLFTHVRGTSFSREDERLIRDFGIGAFQFDQDTHLEPRYIVADKTELHFVNNDAPYSIATSVLNYPFPSKNRLVSNTVYYETKVFEFANHPNAHFAIGLVTRPYPVDLRLPGYNLFSISYESTGNLKINKPFPTPSQQHRGEQSQYNAFVLPPLQQSDIVGFGYVISTGTIFITRNGKKLMDVVTGCYCDMYPAIGCFSTNAKFHVNLGQMGYVWIEANVRKYGFVAASEYKRIAGDLGAAALPQYVRAADADKLLDKGEELPPGYPVEELDFFGRSLKEVKFGSSSRQEEKEKPHESSTTITHDTEEEMDMRSRVYEVGLREDVPLIKESHEFGYGVLVPGRFDDATIEASSFERDSEGTEEFGAEDELHMHQEQFSQDPEAAPIAEEEVNISPNDPLKQKSQDFEPTQPVVVQTAATSHEVLQLETPELEVDQPVEEHTVIELSGDEAQVAASTEEAVSTQEAVSTEEVVSTEEAVSTQEAESHQQDDASEPTEVLDQTDIVQLAPTDVAARLESTPESENTESTQESEGSAGPEEIPTSTSENALEDSQTPVTAKPSQKKKNTKKKKKGGKKRRH